MIKQINLDTLEQVAIQHFISQQMWNEKLKEHFQTFMTYQREVEGEGLKNLYSKEQLEKLLLGASFSRILELDDTIFHGGSCFFVAEK